MNRHTLDIVSNTDPNRQAAVATKLVPGILEAEGDTGITLLDETDHRSMDRIGGTSSTGLTLCCGLTVLSLAALLTVVLVPMSFADLEYYEVRFIEKFQLSTVSTRT